MFVSFSIEDSKRLIGPICISSKAIGSKQEFIDENTFNLFGQDYNILTYIYTTDESSRISLDRYVKFMQKFIYQSLQQILYSVYPSIAEESTSDSENITFTTELCILGTLYTYSFSIKDNKVYAESLYKKDKRNVMLFNRTMDGFDVASNFINKNQSFNLSENMLYLSTYAVFGNDVCRMILNEILNWKSMVMDTHIDLDKLHKDAGCSVTKYIPYLQLIDFTLSDLNFKSENIDGEIKWDLCCTHVMGEESVDLSFVQSESTGIKLMLKFVINLFEALETNSVLFIDRFGNGWHPNLIQYIINKLKHLGSRYNIPMICGVDSIQEIDQVRRDQIYFTDIIAGKSKLRRLSNEPNVKIINSNKYLSNKISELLWKTNEY